MTTRKRKSPEKKKPARREPGVFLVGAAAVGRLVLRHPTLVGGVASFVVVFGFIAANALWYQPGGHPAPFLRTRDSSDLNAMAGVRRASTDPDPADVTTFKIERADPDAPAETATAAQTPATPAAPMPAAAAAAPEADPAVLIQQIQQELADRKLYDGPVDGRRGPKTAAAISAFQASIDMPVSGEPSAELLAALSIDRGATAAVPRDRPAVDLASAQSAIDPVAAAIRSAEKSIVTAPSTQPQAARGKPQPSPPAELASAEPGQGVGGAEAAGLIMEIQRGLSNIAYTDITVDGVAGEQTRAAIRHFERHYRLPETGQPNEAVLKKLKSIGAL
ncbi:peptidoglycan-binding protein [Agrobacterium sp. a22-2]|uniref:peptidoglycan-binding domain-containing protein n=1 Tax=Agrobacterium sp. a22-2 TaxID=2283840 RepID=UPI001445DBE6|nr:peptidoglycan-binding domain-containing protein [Agrobacterium sp. a22-2]NKN39531.1 peptidoglycan-binding protein [Agrobacterium sp. a22-2]